MAGVPGRLLPVAPSTGGFGAFPWLAHVSSRHAWWGARLLTAPLSSAVPPPWVPVAADCLAAARVGLRPLAQLSAFLRIPASPLWCTRWRPSRPLWCVLGGGPGGAAACGLAGGGAAAGGRPLVLGGAAVGQPCARGARRGPGLWLGGALSGLGRPDGPDGGRPPGAGVGGPRGAWAPRWYYAPRPRGGG